jgi:carbonic anhydrase
MTIPGQPTPYEALQFHIHSGTDHAVDGRYFGADFHLVHKQVGGSGFSVLGFFIEPTDPDGIAVFRDLLSEWETVAQGTLSTCTALAALGVVNNTSAAQQGGGRQLNKDEQSHRQLPRSFNPYDLIPEGATMYTYEGSLTTPPCSEVVFWNVIDTPVSVSIREFLRLTNLILNYIKPDTCKFASIASPSGFTGRPVQAINGRTIERICPSGFIDPLASRAASGETGSMSDDSGALSTAGAMAAIASALSAVLAFL